MQKWLDYNDGLIYLTYNESKSVVAERFNRTLKGKLHKKVTANDDKSNLGYLNKLVDKHNNSCYHSICKNFLHENYSDLPEEYESSHNALKVKIGDRVRIFMCKNNFSKGYTERLSK